MTLVIMAAGLGSRYGGLKQIAPIGKNGEILMEYAINDALKAGFDRVVCVIKPEHEQDFAALFKNRAAVEYAYQVPPQNRAKPWGTGHAVLCCREKVKDAFCVINADDFYGASSFEACYGFLSKGIPGECCMAGFRASNTLTEHGTVSRGVCVTDSSNRLTSIQELTKLQRTDGVITDLVTGTVVADDAYVSMNMWGFCAGFPDALAPLFDEFMSDPSINRETAEFYLPAAVSALIERGKIRVSVLPVESKWYGVTYREDIETVRRAIEQLGL